jgi:hypothetical protein
MKKTFNKRSKSHWGVNAGDKFRVIKDHHEVHGDLLKGSIVVLKEISHFPTQYFVHELNTMKTFTVPVHTVEKMI